MTQRSRNRESKCTSMVVAAVAALASATLCELAVAQSGAATPPPANATTAPPPAKTTAAPASAAEGTAVKIPADQLDSLVAPIAL